MAGAEQSAAWLRMGLVCEGGNSAELTSIPLISIAPSHPKHSMYLKAKCHGGQHAVIVRSFSCDLVEKLSLEGHQAGRWCELRNCSRTGQERACRQRATFIPFAVLRWLRGSPLNVFLSFTCSPSALLPHLITAKALRARASWLPLYFFSTVSQALAAV